VHGHAGRAHVEDRGDEVDGAEDRRCAGEMQRQDREVHRGSWMYGASRAADRSSSRRRRRRHRRAFDEQPSRAAAGEADGSSQNEMLFMRGNAMSGAPIIIGTNQLPKPPISAGMTMKNTMISP
jgi:hypothetical protein